MAIRNAQEYEAALEEAIRLMDTEPGREGAEPRLLQLLRDIEAYRPTFSLAQSHPTDELSERAGELVTRALDLKRRWDERQAPRLSSFPQDGQGVGPTTGV